MDRITQNMDIEQNKVIEKEQKEATEKQEPTNTEIQIEEEVTKMIRNKNIYLKLWALKPIVNENTVETIILDTSTITKEDIDNTFYVLDLFDICTADFAEKIRDIYWESEYFLGIYNEGYDQEKKEMEILICKDLEAQIKIIIKGEFEMVDKVETGILETIYRAVAEDEDVLAHVENYFLKFYPYKVITGARFLSDSPEFYIIETETPKRRKEQDFQVEIYCANGKWLYYPKKFRKEDFIPI
ncbi:MAG: hypothetical protein QXY78_04240 [Thermoplasmata archaeon]